MGYEGRGGGGSMPVRSREPDQIAVARALVVRQSRHGVGGWKRAAI